MVDKKKADAETPPEEITAEEVAEARALSTNWEFIDSTPSPEQVADLLRTLPTWWGVTPVNYLDYVQALPSDKKHKVTERTRNGGTRKVEKYFNVITLYFSVAGRLQMLRDAQEMHNWRVDFTPEPTTPTGIPGFLEVDTTTPGGDNRRDFGRLVYREYVEIWVPLLPSGLQAVRTAVELARETNRDLVDDPNPVPQDILAKLPHQTDMILSMPSDTQIITKWIAGQEFALLGRRPGMAWVPYGGGSQAKGSNPYEKVETAARGRALAAWGFGVLPGSGVASLEEMMGAGQNRQAMDAEANAQTGGDPWAGRQQQAEPRESPEELAEQILTLAEEARQLRREPEGWNLTTVRQHMKGVSGQDVATVVDQDGETVLEVDLLKVKPAALLIARNAWRERVAKLKDDQANGS
jgi:hypothetical protein